MPITTGIIFDGCLAGAGASGVAIGAGIGSASGSCGRVCALNIRVYSPGADGVGGGAVPGDGGGAIGFRIGTMAAVSPKILVNSPAGWAKAGVGGGAGFISLRLGADAEAG